MYLVSLLFNGMSNECHFEHFFFEYAAAQYPTLNICIRILESHVYHAIQFHRTFYLRVLNTHGARAHSYFLAAGPHIHFILLINFLSLSVFCHANASVSKVCACPIDRLLSFFFFFFPFHHRSCEYLSVMWKNGRVFVWCVYTHNYF